MMPVEQPLTIPAMLRASAARHASRPALWQRSETELQVITYEQLLGRARSFAAGLRALGLRPGEHVAIVGENSISWAVIFLGISLAGGVAVPVYYRLPAKEQADLLRYADVRFAAVGVGPDAPSPHAISGVERLIAFDSDVNQLPARERGLTALLQALHGREVLTVDDVTRRATAEDLRAIDALKLQPGDLAVILFTSGTMGIPKGVLLTHGNVMSNVWAVNQAVHVGPEDRLLLVLPMHHPFPLTVGLVTPLARGAMLALENDLKRVRERMAEVRPTIFFGVPELYRLLLKTIFARAEAEGRGAKLRTGLRIADLVRRTVGVNIGPLLFRSLHERFGGKLRFMASGGAGLPPDIARQYFRLGFLIIQGWGLSETAPVLTAPAVEPRRFLLTRHYERQAGSVGRALPGIRLRLLDVPDKGIWVRERGEGEIAVQGPNVSPGYYKNPAATSEAFFDDDGRWFRTGDIGRIDPAGNVFLTGRAKTIIVLDSGEKVSPDEIEDALRESPLIADVAVVGRARRKHLRDDKIEVHAIIYPSHEALWQQAARGGVALTPELAQAWVGEEAKRLMQQLAPYKRVREIILTDEPLPKTPLGKIRRGLLPDEYRFDLDRFVAAIGEVG